MNNKTLNYAKLNIDENETKVFISQGNLYIETKSGKNFKLAEDEVMYQATEYLKAEIESLKHI
jgi:ribosomal protein S4E